jgi:Ca-activated chloride channel family protein
MRAGRSRLAHVIVASTAALIMLACAAGGAAAADAANIVILFDGSGSMWGKIGGERQPKHVMARDAIRRAMSRLPATTQVGLISFGHRRSGDCSDVETLIPLEPLDPSRITGTLERLNPKGRGPISLALREAARELGSAPGRLVLIHDDADNCQQDPCATAAEIKRGYPNLSIEVVSIGLKPEDAERTVCLARTTGGVHYQVNSASELTKAVADSFSLVSLEARPRIGEADRTARAPQPPPGKPGVHLSASLAPGGRALDVPIIWRVLRVGTAPGLAYQGEDINPSLTLPSGRYEIEARLGLVAVRRTVDVDAGAAQPVNLTLNAGTLRLSAVSQRASLPVASAIFTISKPEPGTDGATTTRPGEPLLVLRPSQVEIALAPGPYIVSATHGAYRTDRSVIVTAGSRGNLVVTLPTGELDLELSPPGQNAVGDTVFQVFEDDPDAPQGRREVARTAGTDPSFTLAAGTYYVVARRGSAEVRERVTVRSGEVERRTLSLAPAHVTLSWRLASAGDLGAPGRVTYRIERLDGQARTLAQSSQSKASFVVAPGRYRVESRLGVLNARSSREIVLAPGANEEIGFEHAAGLVRLRLVETPGGAPISDAFWEIKDQRGHLVWITGQPEPHAILQAGSYTVRAEVRDKHFDKQIVVASGENRTIEIVAH